MKSTFIVVLSLAIMSLCARSSPIPLDTSSFRSSSRIASSPRTSLLRRGNGAYAFEKLATEEALEKKQKDWKRPVVIAISGIGLAMTVGWNYIAAKSFSANRERYKMEERRLEAERKKPPPKVGDTICIVNTYMTDDQVAERKPSVVEQPCYVLGQQQGAQGRGLASTGQVTASGGQATSPGQVASPNVTPLSPQWTATSSINGGGAGAGVYGALQAPVQQSQPSAGYPSTQQTTSAIDTSSSSTSQNVNPNANASSPSTRQNFSPSIDADSSAAEPTDDATAGAYREAGFHKLLNKRGVGSEAVEEIVEETTTKLHSPPPLSSSSTSPATPPTFPNDRIALLNFERETRARSIPSLSTFSPFSGSSRARPRPGFAFARPLYYPLDTPVFEDVQPLDQMMESDERERGRATVKSTSKLWSKLKAPGQKLSKIPTEDITFGLTVLNTIGGIPSLILTIANAMLYRGNPKVD